MQFSNETLRNIAYGVLGIFALFIMLNSFNIKNNIINSVFGIGNVDALPSINGSSNNIFKSQNEPVREGFTFNTDGDKVEDENLDQCIQRKLTALKSELGGKSGISDIKKILENAKQACNYEASKCMMNLLSSNKNTKTINLENILEDPDNRDCAKYKDYTGLSKQLQNLIDNL